MELTIFADPVRVICVKIYFATTPQKFSINEYDYPEQALQWLQYVDTLNNTTMRIDHNSSDQQYKNVLVFFSDLNPPQTILNNFGEIYREQLFLNCICSGQWSFLSSISDDENHIFIKNVINGNTIKFPISLIPQECNIAKDLIEVNKCINYCTSCHQATICSEITYYTTEDYKCIDCNSSTDLTSFSEESVSAKQGYVKCKCCLYNFVPISDVNGTCQTCISNGTEEIILSFSDMTLSEIKNSLKRCNCGTFFKADESWKTSCTECYVKQKENTNTDPNKMCKMCNKLFFADASWKDTCLDCYRSGSINCPSCGKSFLKKFNYQKTCYTCYKNNK